MSDTHDWTPGDPFAPDAVEDTIAQSLRAGAPATPSATLVRALADAYTLPPAAAVLARSRATLARRAAAVEDERRQPGGARIIPTDSRQTPAPFSTRPPNLPHRRVGPFAAAARTAAAVLVVALLGAGFFALLHGMPRPGGRPTPTATPSTATPTTARVLALYPYMAPAPGPGCDQGAAVWTLVNATPARNVVCFPTSTRLIAAPLGAFVSTSLRGAPLPARYTIRLSVVNITPCTAAIWHVATETQSGFDLRLNGPAAPTCGGLGYDLETTLPSGAGRGGGYSYPVQTDIHSVVLQVDGTQVQLVLDGVLMDSFTEAAPPVWSVVQLGVSQLGGSGPASADFSNFIIA